ncbi:hypothetical protein AB0B12_28630 [Streptomyces sp. NPDC044780]|uniref:hypothetical protein n=1 Tax=unclassified Streptomyces TaxID=2593676 RepID=UPI0033DE9C5E
MARGVPAGSGDGDPEVDSDAPHRVVALGPPDAAGDRTESLAKQDPADCRHPRHAIAYHRQRHAGHAAAAHAG